ncbi:hypothetical protein D3C86_2165190 [compost metagenome]
MRVGRKPLQNSEHPAWKLAASGDLARELLQLLRIRQLAVQQQVGGFLKAGKLGKLFNGKAAIR